ncbi:D-hexose-6-phosphate mutarotase [Cellulomonas timonensis]|uniref:D-hexose-6-phosphate mutarotase n=1 Tax=Cellulomonas timonensis TaxID=1689271 RepID=UPI0008295910|nr:D-hexose-6-phosphate mutarotase [Cellulomonas timonensis]
MSSLPQSVTVSPGRGGLPRVRVAGPAASGEIYLNGAHVTSWRPDGQGDVLWMSAASGYSPGQPLRGGIPLCFPWFGAHAADPAAPAHGFARRTAWDLLGAEEDGDDMRVRFGLHDSAATRAGAWPHRFEATCTVTIGPWLSVTLDVVNRDDRDVVVEEALHTYLSVGDVREARVTGLEGAWYIDKLAAPELVAQDGPIRFTAETDRVYLGTRATALVEDPSRARAVTVAKSGSASTVVWNPWAAKAAAMPDFGDDEWTGMLCVETGNVGVDAVRLAPGEGHQMTAHVGLAPLA